MAPVRASERSRMLGLNLHTMHTVVALGPTTSKSHLGHHEYGIAAAAATASGTLLTRQDSMASQRCFDAMRSIA